LDRKESQSRNFIHLSGRIHKGWSLVRETLSELGTRIKSRGEEGEEVEHKTRSPSLTKGPRGKSSHHRSRSRHHSLSRYRSKSRHRSSYREHSRRRMRSKSRKHRRRRIRSRSRSRVKRRSRSIQRSRSIRRCG